MATMSRRLQILIDEPRYQALARESRRTGKSVAELIRESVDESYSANLTDRAAAVAEVLAEDPMPVQEWDDMKEDILDALSGGP